MDRKRTKEIIIIYAGLQIYRQKKLISGAYRAIENRRARGFSVSWSGLKSVGFRVCRILFTKVLERVDFCWLIIYGKSVKALLAVLWLLS